MAGSTDSRYSQATYLIRPGRGSAVTQQRSRASPRATRRAREDVAADEDRVGVAGPVGHHAAGLADQQRARRDVPEPEAELEVTVERRRRRRRRGRGSPPRRGEDPRSAPAPRSTPAGSAAGAPCGGTGIRWRRRPRPGGSRPSRRRPRAIERALAFGRAPGLAEQRRGHRADDRAARPRRGQR